MNILNEICENKIREIEFDKKKYSLNTLEKITNIEPNRGFNDLITKKTMTFKSL